MADPNMMGREQTELAQDCVQLQTLVLPLCEWVSVVIETNLVHEGPHVDKISNGV
jgi:hypothetical protein